MRLLNSRCAAIGFGRQNDLICDGFVHQEKKRLACQLQICHQLCEPFFQGI